ncbi:LytR family transcriptional regulator [Streptomyces sp. NRRL F-4489]|uniref:LCP family protein n=1 Tax=Streptomyces sp. NRRL F-4489 TaxID=1609095 RepID=UPI0007495EA4|nr:LCP family protein [Streptomyces sp. NRRL F-4489]KUL42572.1 LytR family transcriptional regulator [Streptomyces sp. NRRL F-4489]
MTESPENPPPPGRRRSGKPARFQGWPERPAGVLRTDRPGPPRTPPARHRRWLRAGALALAVAVPASGALGWAIWTRLNGNIRSDSATERELEKYESERPPAGPPNAQNILLIGSDNRSGANREYGTDTGTQRSDTTILLHLAADRRSATAVSIPRDLMVAVPHCKRADGQESAARTAEFNWAFAYGGAACAIRTVERMTRIRVDHHIIVDFTGFKNMVDAVHGVQLCLARPIRDEEAHLSLPAGRQTLDGEAALGFVRARKSLGDGSDTQRMARQQQFLGALVKKVQSNGVLLNPMRLYPVMDAATSSLTTDAGLASLRGLYELVRGMRSIPTAQVRFLTVPRTEYRYDPNRDELVQPDAERLFSRLRKDQPVAVAPRRAGDGKPRGAGRAARPAPAGSAVPVFPGSTAEHAACE